MSTPHKSHPVPAATAKTGAKGTKRPKAAVMFANHRDMSGPRNKFSFPPVCHESRGEFCKDPCAVLPLPARQARELVKFTNMTEGERVEVVSISICRECDGPWSEISPVGKNDYRDLARAVLQRLGLGGEAK